MKLYTIREIKNNSVRVPQRETENDILSNPTEHSI